MGRDRCVEPGPDVDRSSARVSREKDGAMTDLVSEEHVVRLAVPSTSGVLEVDEFQPIPVDGLQLQESEFQQLLAVEDNRRLFNIEYHRSGIHLRPRGYIGLLPVSPGLSVSVRSKLPLPILVHILERSRGLPELVSRAWSNVSLSEAPAEHAIEILGRAFVVALDDILDLGWLRVYSAHTEFGAFPKGRILVGETINQWVRGRNYGLVYTQYTPTIDNSINALIRSALDALISKLSAASSEALLARRQPLLSELVSRSRMFLGVSPMRMEVMTRAPVELSRSSLPAARVHYLPAIELAHEILAGCRVTGGWHDDDLSLPHFAIDMRSVFEAFVRNVLAIRVPQFDARLRILDGQVDLPDGGRKTLFDKSDEYHVEPDVVVSSGDDKYRLIADVKYVPILGSIDRDYVERLLLYALAYAARDVLLIYPSFAGGQEEIKLHGSVSNVNVWSFACCLSDTDPNSIEEALGDAVSSALGAH